MPRKDDPKATQLEAFFEKARELGCDERPAAFDKMLKKVASAPPPKSVKKRKAAIARRKKMK